MVATRRRSILDQSCGLFGPVRDDFCAGIGDQHGVGEMNNPQLGLPHFRPDHKCAAVLQFNICAGSESRLHAHAEPCAMAKFQRFGGSVSKRSVVRGRFDDTVDAASTLEQSACFAMPFARGAKNVLRSPGVGHKCAPHDAVNPAVRWPNFDCQRSRRLGRLRMTPCKICRKRYPGCERNLHYFTVQYIGAAAPSGESHLSGEFGSRMTSLPMLLRDIDAFDCNACTANEPADGIIAALRRFAVDG